MASVRPAIPPPIIAIRILFGRVEDVVDVGVGA